MNEMNITEAQWISIIGTEDVIRATIDGTIVIVPVSEGNRHYDEIMRQVDAGTLTISEPE